VGAHSGCTCVFLQAIFLKFDLFTKRLNKLIDMFTTIHQFSTLEQHTHIEGLEQMIRNLNNIIGVYQGLWGRQITTQRCTMGIGDAWRAEQTHAVSLHGNVGCTCMISKPDWHVCPSAWFLCR
jgi:hypothetical protein